MFAWKWRRSHEGPDPPRVPGRAAALVVEALPAWAFRAPSRWWLAWFGLTPLLLVVGAAPTARVGVVGTWRVRAGRTQYWLLPSAGCVAGVCRADVRDRFLAVAVGAMATAGVIEGRQTRS